MDQHQLPSHPGNASFWDLLRRRPTQPDARSCGAVSLVLAEAWRNERYAEWLASAPRGVFDVEVMGMHRRTTSPIDVQGRWQLPWARQLGTPPWAVTRQLTGTRHRRHRVKTLRDNNRRATVWASAQRAAKHGWPVPVFVGTRLVPRHVLLLLDEDRCYDPSSGELRPVATAEVIAGRLDWGWPVPWAVVVPRSIGR